MVSAFLITITLLLPLTECRSFKQAPEGYREKNISLEKVDTGKKILVVYFSKTGNTERVAKDIAAAMNADIEKIIDKKDRSGCLGWFAAGSDGISENSTEIEPVKSNASEYDIVIIGSPVWGWNMTPAVRKYIVENKSKIKEVAFFITAGGTTIDEVLPFMEILSEKKSVKSFGLVEDELNQPEIYAKKINDFVSFFRKK